MFFSIVSICLGSLCELKTHCRCESIDATKSKRLSQCHWNTLPLCSQYCFTCPLKALCHASNIVCEPLSISDDSVYLFERFGIDHDFPHQPSSASIFFCTNLHHEWPPALPSARTTRSCIPALLPALLFPQTSPLRLSIRRFPPGRQDYSGNSGCNSESPSFSTRIRRPRPRWQYVFTHPNCFLR
jgi:hypothetical protein